MSEEQRKPAKKWYMVSKPLAYLFILFVLLCVAGVCVLAVGPVGGHPDTCRECAYDTATVELQNAVNDYQNKNQGTLPTFNSTVTINGSAYKIINVCPLLTQSRSSLKTVIESLWYHNGSNNDNCNSDCTVCNAYGSYIWAVDDQGNVYSTCVGEDCKSNGEDGYQGVWP